MISREELDRIREMADHYINPPHPRTGDVTVALYEQLVRDVMRNLPGLLEAAEAAHRTDLGADVSARLDRLEAAVLELNPGLNWP